MKLKLAAQAKRLELKRAVGLLPSQLHNVKFLTFLDRWGDAVNFMLDKLELQLEEPVFDEFTRGVLEIIREDPAAVRAQKQRNAPRSDSTSPRSSGRCRQKGFGRRPPTCAT